MAGAPPAPMDKYDWETGELTAADLIYNPLGQTMEATERMTWPNQLVSADPLVISPRSLKEQRKSI